MRFFIWEALQSFHTFNGPATEVAKVKELSSL
jgi:hypothetical protein